MAARPGYAQPDPRYPFANAPMPQQYPQQYQQRRRDYDAESDYSDQYGSRNTSTTHLTANSTYDHAGQFGQFDSRSEYYSPSIITLLSSPVPFPLSTHCKFFSIYSVGLPSSPRSWFIFTQILSLFATRA
jgi:hypothetical protein